MASLESLVDLAKEVKDHHSFWAQIRGLRAQVVKYREVFEARSIRWTPFCEALTEPHSQLLFEENTESSALQDLSSQH